jgi:hypothetical protein
MVREIGLEAAGAAAATTAVAETRAGRRKYLGSSQLAPGDQTWRATWR